MINSIISLACFKIIENNAIINNDYENILRHPSL